MDARKMPADARTRRVEVGVMKTTIIFLFLIVVLLAPDASVSAQDVPVLTVVPASEWPLAFAGDIDGVRVIARLRLVDDRNCDAEWIAANKHGFIRSISALCRWRRPEDSTVEIRTEALIETSTDQGYSSKHSRETYILSGGRLSIKFRSQTFALEPAETAAINSEFRRLADRF